MQDTQWDHIHIHFDDEYDTRTMTLTELYQLLKAMKEEEDASQEI